LHKTKWGWGCTGYKDGCKYTINGTVASKKLTEKQVSDLLTKGKTSQIKGFKSKTGKSFSAALRLNDENKIEFDFGK
jgi:DNA topoisomerase-3